MAEGIHERWQAESGMHRAPVLECRPKLTKSTNPRVSGLLDTAQLVTGPCEEEQDRWSTKSPAPKLGHAFSAGTRPYNPEVLLEVMLCRRSHVKLLA